ncbi:MAG TPA: M24 family metallopeptidase [bacterium]|nr:M24 family metallopeptidase [bacterium]
MKKARFIYDISEKNADMFYATKFRAPDPFIYFELGGKKHAVMNDLEYDRARRESCVDKVVRLSPYVERAEKKMKSPGQVDVIHEILSEHGVRLLEVPQDAPFALMDALRAMGYSVTAGPSPFYPERFVKTAEERRNILKSQRVVFRSISFARDVLRSSRIKGKRLVYRGRTLTSESLRSMINIFLLERGFIAPETIVSCGLHAIDPHDTGSGPLLPHSSIIVDVYPRSQKTFYYGDATRTFCRGRAPEALKKMYATVKEGQALGLSMIRAGVEGRRVHEAIHSFFAGRGYETGEKDGRRQGFFHGTGHSIGLEVHEEPLRITYRDCTLAAGNVMSVEPGLYYKGIGGVRIEDLVHVTRSGCEILAGFPKVLEV